MEMLLKLICSCSGKSPCSNEVICSCLSEGFKCCELCSCSKSQNAETTEIEVETEIFVIYVIVHLYKSLYFFE